MKEGEILLIDMAQSDRTFTVRPALILKILPKYGGLLLCGISSKLNQELKGIDEMLNADADYFSATGLHQTSVIRLLFLAIQKQEQVLGRSETFPTHSTGNYLKDWQDFLLPDASLQ